MGNHKGKEQESARLNFCLYTGVFLIHMGRAPHKHGVCIFFSFWFLHEARWDLHDKNFLSSWTQRYTDVCCKTHERVLHWLHPKLHMKAILALLPCVWLRRVGNIHGFVCPVFVFFKWCPFSNVFTYFFGQFRHLNLCF